jgi:alpha-tubulin suppressor-like RCC1 family protein
MPSALGRVRGILVLAALSVGTNACLKLDIADGFTCAKDGQCPSPYHCDRSTNQCRRASTGNDAGNDSFDAPVYIATDASSDTVFGVEGGAEIAGGLDTAVDTGCTSGQHRCSGACVDDTSTDHCGPGSCDECIPPAGGTATCDGATCGFTCGATSKVCKTTCISSASCCDDSDCAPQGGKMGKCDTSTHVCGYTCGTGTTPCNGVCIPSTGCCVESDCAGTCRACVNNACATVTSKDDADSCLGTCDATGACKSKQGQSCQTVAAGCVAGSTCAPDGTCCNTACTESCKACDLPGTLGICTPLAAGVAPHGNRSCGVGACAGSCGGAATGACTYPTTACGSQTCSGTSVVDQGTCAAGACVAPVPRACAGGYVCSGNACETSCASDADCAPTSYCAGGTCHLDAVQVAAGNHFSCAVLVDGTARCWGYSSEGVLGNGFTTGDTSTPTLVGSLNGVKVTSVTTGEYSACALLAGGTVRCWGETVYGQTGDASVPTPADVPIAVPGVSGATALASGSVHSCAIVAGGQVKCWGNNYADQIGDGHHGTMIEPPSTVLLAGGAPLTGAIAIGAGDVTSCAALSDSTVWCWGGNLGSTGVSAPTKVGALNTAVSVRLGHDHACALLTGGAVTCWGGNGNGQLGNDTMTTSAAPVALSGNVSGFISIAAGYDATCGILSDGSGRCWGAANLLGTAAFPGDRGTPVGIMNLSGATSVSVGFDHACAVLSSGRISCWGDNSYGQIGQNSATISSSQTPVTVTAW